MLDTQVQAMNAFVAKVQANAIIKVIPEIFNLYQVAVPTDLGRLDYLGREILLKRVYAAVDEQSALNEFDRFEELWGSNTRKLGTSGGKTGRG